MVVESLTRRAASRAQSGDAFSGSRNADAGGVNKPFQAVTKPVTGFSTRTFVRYQSIGLHLACCMTDPRGNVEGKLRIFDGFNGETQTAIQCGSPRARRPAEDFSGPCGTAFIAASTNHAHYRLCGRSRASWQERITSNPKGPLRSNIATDLFPLAGTDIAW